jgi:hypothetical protein
MDDILAKAKEYGKPFSLLKIAHERSAEWHRSLGEKLGGAEKGISTIVGTAVFVGVASQLGLDGNGTISIPKGFWAGVLYVLVLLLLISAPLLTALQMFRKDAEQSIGHRDSFAAYGRLEQRIDIFRLTFSSGTDRNEALKGLDEISKELKTIRRQSIMLTKRAYKDAESELTRREVAHSEAAESQEIATGDVGDPRHPGPA